MTDTLMDAAEHQRLRRQLFYATALESDSASVRLTDRSSELLPWIEHWQANGLDVRRWQNFEDWEAQLEQHVIHAEGRARQALFALWWAILQVKSCYLGHNCREPYLAEQVEHQALDILVTAGVLAAEFYELYKARIGSICLLVPSVQCMASVAPETDTIRHWYVQAPLFAYAKQVLAQHGYELEAYRDRAQLQALLDEHAEAIAQMHEAALAQAHEADLEAGFARAMWGVEDSKQSFDRTYSKWRRKRYNIKSVE